MELDFFDVIVGHDVWSLSVVDEDETLAVKLELADKNEAVAAERLVLLSDWLQAEQGRVEVFEDFIAQ